MEQCRELIQQALAADHSTRKRKPPSTEENAAQSEPERELHTGVFCAKCQAKMESAIEIEGAMTCWMLNVSLLVVAWLTQHRLPSLPISSDADSIAQALKAVVERLQEQAWNRDQGRSLELSRCAGMTPGDLFYDEAHHQFQLILIAQQIAQQQAIEDRLIERMSAPNRSNTRGPPSAKMSKKECGLLEVQSC